MKLSTGFLILVIWVIQPGFIQIPYEQAVHFLELTICAIQGAGYQSYYAGEYLTTHGIVFLDLEETTIQGFYLQDEDCDNNSSTSDGIFISLTEESNLVHVGDLVQVSGLVKESYGLTNIEVSPGDLLVLKNNQPLPVLIELAPPRLDSDLYFESLEGMYSGLGTGLVVGPTDADRRTWLVRADLGIGRVWQGDPAGTDEVICVDDRGVYLIEPQVKVGDLVLQLAGTLEDRLGEYCLQLSQIPIVQPQGTPPPGFEIPKLDFSLATLNLMNLFDTIDDPLTDDDVLSASAYQVRLQKHALAIQERLLEPALIAIQEVEHAGILQSLVNRPEIKAQYHYVWEDSPDPRGLDIGLLYRIDQVEIISHYTRQACTTLIDGFGPDGNGNPAQPSNQVTCDSDGDGELDGNRLFSRPPLVVQLRICGTFCQSGPPGYRQSSELWMILNHLKSKTEDRPYKQYTLPRRVEEAEFVAGLVQELRALTDVNSIIVLGDLNDFPDSQPLQILRQAGLVDLTDRITPASRYSFNYHGISQMLDYILVDLPPPLAILDVDLSHTNADFPVVFENIPDSVYRHSDHDPLLANVQHMNQFIFLPILSR